MRRPSDTARVMRHAALVGIADHRAIYTWRIWLVGWFARVIAEVSFYGLIGNLLNSEQRVAFLIVGNSVLISCTVALLAVQSTAWERMAGTLPLLVVSPTRPLVVFLGRSVEWLPDAFASSMGGLIIVGLAFDVHLPVIGLLWVAPVLLVGIIGTYGQAAFVGAVVLRAVKARNLASNTVRSVMAVVTGANVAVSYFPDWVGWIGTLFPATHALRAIRALLADESPSASLGDVGWCLVIGLLWLALAAAAIEHFVERGRATGSIEFAGV